MPSSLKKSFWLTASVLLLQTGLYFGIAEKFIQPEYLILNFKSVSLQEAAALVLFPFYVENLNALFQLMSITLVLFLLFGRAIQQLLDFKWFCGCMATGLVCHLLVLPSPTSLGGLWPFMMGGMFFLFLQVPPTMPIAQARKEFGDNSSPFSLKGKLDALVFAAILMDLIYLSSLSRPGEESLPQMLGIYIFSYFYSKQSKVSQSDLDLKPPAFKLSRLKTNFIKSRLFKSGQSSPKYPLQPVTLDKIDQILDKINEQGISSLSKDERYLLERASSQLKKDIFNT